jgi:hypothetical protein
MAKYEFKWTDLQVTDLQMVLDDLLTMNLPPSRRSFLHDFANQVSAQRPQPLPTKLGAVVHTKEGIFVRRIGTDNRDRVWWRVPDGDWLTNSEVGPVLRVLSEGVDL